MLQTVGCPGLETGFEVYFCFRNESQMVNSLRSTNTDDDDDDGNYAHVWFQSIETESSSVRISQACAARVENSFLVIALLTG